MDVTPRDLGQQGSTPPRVDAAALRALVDSVVIAAHGLAVFDVEWAGNVLRVFIERAPLSGSSADASSQLLSGSSADASSQLLSGVTLEDCVGVSRDLSTALDIADLIPHAYSLEVSSPGLNRPLKSASDFKRHIGKLAKVKLHVAASDGQLALRGAILGAGGEGIAMEVDGKRHEVPLANVREAKLVFELGGAEPSKGKKRPKKTKEGRKRRK